MLVHQSCISHFSADPDISLKIYIFMWWGNEWTGYLKTSSDNIDRRRIKTGYSLNSFTEALEGA